VTGMHRIDDDLDEDLAADVAQLARRLRDARPAPTGTFAWRVHAALAAMHSPAGDGGSSHASLTPGPLHGNSPG
jgi:hypothetical protein